MEETLDEIVGLKTVPGHIGKFVSKDTTTRRTSFQIDGEVQKNDLLLVPSTGERMLVLRRIGNFIEVARGWGTNKRTIVPSGASFLVLGSAF